MPGAMGCQGGKNILQLRLSPLEPGAGVGESPFPGFALPTVPPSHTTHPRPEAPFMHSGPDLHAALHRASRRYRRLCRPGTLWLWGYSRSKFRMDPAYLQVAALIPPRSLTLDLGSGLALLPALLAELGEERRVIAVEWDRSKVEAARRILGDHPGFQIERADAFEFEFPACDTVVLMDVLHYFPESLQDRLLQKACAALRPGGRLILRETEAQRGGGRAFTRGLEWFAIHCGWNRGPELHYRTRFQWLAALEALGIRQAESLDSSRFTPGNILIHGIKEEAS